MSSCRIYDSILKIDHVSRCDRPYTSIVRECIVCDPCDCVGCCTHKSESLECRDRSSCRYFFEDASMSQSSDSRSGTTRDKFERDCDLESSSPVRRSCVHFFIQKKITLDGLSSSRRTDKSCIIYFLSPCWKKGRTCKSTLRHRKDMSCKRDRLIHDFRSESESVLLRRSCGVKLTSHR